MQTNHGMDTYTEMLPFWRSLESRTQSILTKNSSVVERGEGEYLYVTGQRKANWFILIDGLCMVESITPEGNESFGMLFYPGQLVAPDTIDTDCEDCEFYERSLKALSDCRFLRVQFRHMRFLREDPAFDEWLNRSYCETVRRCYQALELAKKGEMESRVKSFLRDHKKYYSDTVTINQSQIGTALCMNRVDVNRIVGKLKRNGSINTEPLEGARYRREIRIGEIDD